MRVLHTNFSKTNDVDGWINHIVKGHLSYTQVLEEADIVLFGFTWQAGFEFDSELALAVADSGKPIVVWDYHEHTEVHRMSILGYHIEEEKLTENYRVVHKFLSRYRPAAYFKRELSSMSPLDIDSCPFPVHPIDYMHEFDDLDPVSFHDYNRRPLDVMMTYGFSHISRYLLHGELMKSTPVLGWTVHHNLEDLAWWNSMDRKHDRAILIMPIPHYRRLPIADVNEAQGQAKMAVTCYGAGQKCWRSAEAAYNSLMVIQDPTLTRWAYPWVDGENCITMPNVPGSETVNSPQAVSKMLRYLHQTPAELYPIYKECVLNNRKYHAPAYLRGYVLPKIEEALSSRQEQSGSSAEPRPVAGQPAVTPIPSPLPLEENGRPPASHWSPGAR